MGPKKQAPTKPNTESDKDDFVLPPKQISEETKATLLKNLAKAAPGLKNNKKPVESDSSSDEALEDDNSDSDDSIEATLKRRAPEVQKKVKGASAVAKKAPAPKKQRAAPKEPEPEPEQEESEPEPEEKPVKKPVKVVKEKPVVEKQEQPTQAPYQPKPQFSQPRPIPARSAQTQLQKPDTDSLNGRLYDIFAQPKSTNTYHSQRYLQRILQ
jgi:hypothetical protein